ncbi:MAG TPA: hypothetical protein VN729_09880 [Ktedonobacteraceae bacterium]|nr:hypothetical protein [Ktedonobacteraceae bacterium]
MEARLHLYIGGNVEAKLDHTSPPKAAYGGSVEPRLDVAPNVEPEPRLRLASRAVIPFTGLLPFKQF